MSGPLFLELLGACQKAGGLSQRLVKHNAEKLGHVYRSYSPKSVLMTYLACGVPLGLYTGSFAYSSFITEDYYQKPYFSDFVVGSVAGSLVATLATPMWPLVLPGVIGHHRRNQKKKKIE